MALPPHERSRMRERRRDALVPGATQRASDAAQNRDRRKRDARFVSVTAPAQQRTTKALRCVRGKRA
jgi:hypothetical protein